MNCYANVRTASFGLVLGLSVDCDRPLSQDQTPVGRENTTAWAGEAQPGYVQGPRPRKARRVVTPHLVMKQLRPGDGAAVTPSGYSPTDFAQCL